LRAVVPDAQPPHGFTYGLHRYGTTRYRQLLLHYSVAQPTNALGPHPVASEKGIAFAAVDSHHLLGLYPLQQNRCLRFQTLTARG